MRSRRCLVVSLWGVLACGSDGDDGDDGADTTSGPASTGGGSGTSEGDAHGSAGTGTGSGEPSGGSGGSTGVGTGAASSDAGASSSETGEPVGPSFGSGSAFDDVMQMFEYLNEQRQGYLPHDRWRGLPWTGSQHQVETWPVMFTWDDDLADTAQLEADALAAGAAPDGEPATDGLTPPLYVRGVDTAHYVVLGPEEPNSWGMSNMSSLGREHGSARMALYYHDPGGEGPVLQRVGIGASDAGDGSTWWVLVFE